MAECASAQVRFNDLTESRQKELQRLIQDNCGLQPMEDYYYDGTHHSYVMLKDKTCVILDYNLCAVEEGTDKVFDYSKYCEMQNIWMMSSDRLFRFYVTADMLFHNDDKSVGQVSEEEEPVTSICAEINRWLTLDPENIEVSDNGGSFDKGHIDNTPLEKTFEDLFIDAYGYDCSFNYSSSIYR